MPYCFNAHMKMSNFSRYKHEVFVGCSFDGCKNSARAVRTHKFDNYPHTRLNGVEGAHANEQTDCKLEFIRMCRDLNNMASSMSIMN